ncbi:unnamed protein product, partial [Rotaria socialis]
EFQRLTDRIEVLTKARNTLTEYLHELEGQSTVKTLPYSTSYNDVTSMNHQLQPQLQDSPTIPQSNRSSPAEKPHYHHTSSTSSIHSDSSQRPRSPSMTPSNFIRVHFPNKHTTALAPRSDETLEIALESRASRHSITNLRAYTPVYMISRQPCQWDITLDRLLETEIELEENLKLDHSFENIPVRRFPLLNGVRCIVCHRHIREAYKRCTSCGNNYHNHCCSKAPVCSHPILQHIKHLSPDRFNIDRTSTQSRNKEQSRSLPRIPLSRPGINTSQGVGPQKHTGQNSHGTPLPTTTNVDYFPNAIQSTMNISSNSLFQPLSTNMSSSLPSATSPIHHIPQLLLTMNDSTVTNPGSLRPSMIKPNSEGLIDAKKPAHKYISEWEIRPEDILKHGRMVGRGTYGTVYKAEVRLHGNVALKELNFVSPTPTQFQAFRNEVFALKKITHQNTLNFYGYIISPRFAIVTQWCEIMWLVGKGRLKIKVEQCRDDTPEAIVELIRQCSDFHREQRPKFSPEIDDTLSKFEFIFPRLQRSQSEPCLIRNPQDDLLGLSMNFGVPKTPSSNHRRFNAEVS